MFAFVVLDFGFSVLSQEIAWEERLQNDLFCPEGCKTLTQSTAFEIVQSVLFEIADAALPFEFDCCYEQNRP